MYSRSNATGRSVLTLVGIVGWISAGVGVIACLYGVSNMAGLTGSIALVGGIFAITGGMVQVAISQVGTASFDRKDISLEMLKILKHQANGSDTEVSRSVELPHAVETATAGSATRDPADPNMRVYKGVQIDFSDADNHWHALGERYSTLGKAKRKIDEAVA